MVQLKTLWVVLPHYKGTLFKFQPIHTFALASRYFQRDTYFCITWPILAETRQKLLFEERTKNHYRSKNFTNVCYMMLSKNIWYCYQKNKISMTWLKLVKKETSLQSPRPKQPSLFTLESRKDVAHGKNIPNSWKIWQTNKSSPFSNNR